MSLKVLYITFTDFGELSSGSSVRPFRMYNALVNLGYDVKLLEGQQNRRKERQAKVKEIINWLDENKPDICYVEPPSGPFFNQIDISLLKKVHNMGVPIGLFYRDFYWRFSKWAWKGTPLWKQSILKMMHRRDLAAFKKYCDVVYFPSQECTKVLADVKFKEIGILPPGCNEPKGGVKIGAREIFYAGGVREADGMDDLLISLDRINKSGLDVKLNLITKKEELVHIKNSSLLDSDWIEVMEASGEALEPIYAKCDLGILPKKRHFYMDMAISVKVLECMSHGLPMISTDCPAMARFIEQNESGIICKEGSESIEEAIRKYYTDEELYKRLIENVKKAALNNTWEKRIEQVVSDLLNEKTN